MHGAKVKMVVITDICEVFFGVCCGSESYRPTTDCYVRSCFILFVRVFNVDCYSIFSMVLCLKKNLHYFNRLSVSLST